MAPKKVTRYGIFQFKHDHTDICESCRDLQDTLDFIERECLHDGIAAGSTEEMYAEMDVIKRSLAFLHDMGRSTRLSVPWIGRTIQLCTSAVQRPGFSLRSPIKKEYRTAEQIAVIDKLEQANKSGSEISLSVHELMLIGELSKNWPTAKPRIATQLFSGKTHTRPSNSDDQQHPMDSAEPMSEESLKVVKTSFRNWCNALSPDLTLKGLLVAEGAVSHKKPDPTFVTDIIRSTVRKLKHAAEGCDCEQLDAKESTAALEMITACSTQMRVASSRIREVQILLDSSIKSRVSALKVFQKALLNVGRGHTDVHRRALYNQQIFIQIILAKIDELILEKADLGQKMEKLEADLQSRDILDSAGVDRFVHGALNALSSRYIPGVSGLDEVQDHLIDVIAECNAQFGDLEKLKIKMSEVKAEATKETDRLRLSLATMTRRVEKLTSKQNAWEEKEKAKEVLIQKQIATKNKKLTEAENSIRLIRDNDGLRRDAHRKAIEKLEQQIAAKDDEISGAKKDATSINEKLNKRLKSLHQKSQEAKQELEALQSTTKVFELDLEATQEALDVEKAKTATLEGLLKDGAPKDAEIANLTLENRGLLAKLRTNDTVEADKLKSVTGPLKAELAKLKSEVLRLREQKAKDDEYLRQVLRERAEDKVELDQKTEALEVLENLRREERSKNEFLKSSMGTPYF